jgi:bacteriocin-like protein
MSKENHRSSGSGLTVLTEAELDQVSGGRGGNGGIGSGTRQGSSAQPQFSSESRNNAVSVQVNGVG